MNIIERGRVFVQSLRALAERNELTKVENVMAVLKKEKGENDETH